MTEASRVGERPSGVGERPSGVGERLRQAREDQGLGVDDVAQQLKFAPRQIESLEHERFDRLPGPTIARGMVRNYARLLKLDPEPLLDRMGPPPDNAPRPGRIAESSRREVAFSDGGKRSTLVYAAFSVGLLALVGAVAYEWHREEAALQFVAPAREPSEPAPPPKELAPAAALPAPVAEAPAPPAKAPEPAPVQAQAPAAAEKAPAPAEKASAEDMHRLVVRCEEESWIEIKDGAGRTLLSSLNPPGTERAVRGRGPFDIVIGNARAVTLTYDGKPIDLRPHTKVQVARLTLK